MIYRGLNRFHFVPDIDIDKPLSLKASVTMMAGLVCVVITVLVGLFHA